MAKTRAAHEKAVDELKKLYDIRKEQQQEQLLKAMMSSKWSFEEILTFISDDTVSEEDILWTNTPEWYFGYKAHIGVDKESGLVHTVKVTAANEHDVTVTSELLTGDEE